LAHTYTYDPFGRLTKKTDGTYTADYYYHYGDTLTKVASKGRSAAVGRKVGRLLATAPLGLCLPGCPQGGCMSRWAKGEGRRLRMVGVGKRTATGTRTRVGVAGVMAEWLGWCDCRFEVPALHGRDTVPQGLPSRWRIRGVAGGRGVTAHSMDEQPALMCEAVPAVWGDGVLVRLTPFPGSGAAYYFRALCLGQECPSSLFREMG